MNKKVTIWISPNDIMIPADLIPGCIADAQFPRPVRGTSTLMPPDSDQASGHDVDDSRLLSSKIPEVDAHAAERLIAERKQALRLRQKMCADLPANRGLSDLELSVSDVAAYLSNLGLELEIRRFSEAPIDIVENASADSAKTDEATVPMAAAEQPQPELPSTFVIPQEHSGQEQATETFIPDDQVTALFDPVSIMQLEAMFPWEGKWKRSADHAARCGLLTAQVSRGKYNPYLAALWWLRKCPKAWTSEACMRKLANNLPPRSRGLERLLVGYD